MERNEAHRRVIEGYERLAFGSPVDAVRLLMADKMPPPAKMREMDLFAVEEIRRYGNGGIEIRFADRARALDRLLAVSEAENTGELYRMLEDAAGRMKADERT